MDNETTLLSILLFCEISTKASGKQLKVSQDVKAGITSKSGDLPEPAVHLSVGSNPSRQKGVTTDRDIRTL